MPLCSYPLQSKTSSYGSFHRKSEENREKTSPHARTPLPWICALPILRCLQNMIKYARKSGMVTSYGRYRTFDHYASCRDGSAGKGGCRGRRLCFFQRGNPRGIARLEDEA